MRNIYITVGFSRIWRPFFCLENDSIGLNNYSLVADQQIANTFSVDIWFSVVNMVTFNARRNGEKLAEYWSHHDRPVYKRFKRKTKDLTPNFCQH